MKFAEGLSSEKQEETFTQENLMKFAEGLSSEKQGETFTQENLMKLSRSTHRP
jgi:hypothetical protein